MDRRALFLVWFIVLIVTGFSVYMILFITTNIIKTEDEVKIMFLVLISLTIGAIVVGKLLVEPTVKVFYRIFKRDLFNEILEWHSALLSDNFEIITIGHKAITSNQLANADDYMTVIDWGENGMAHFFVAYSRKNNAYVLFGRQDNLLKSKNKFMLNIPGYYHKKAWKYFGEYEVKNKGLTQ